MFQNTGRLLIHIFLYAVLINVALKVMKKAGLTQTLLHKYEDDETHKHSKHQQWYQVSCEKLSEHLRPKFTQLDQDDETSEFLRNCYDKSDLILWQLYHSISIPILKLFMTQTDVNGYLGRGSMFVFSKRQFIELIDTSLAESWIAGTLLDLGAGDGKVTDMMATHFGNVFVTEISSQMQHRLREKNYSVLGIDDWSTQKYDVISCLNLLDRCDKPMTLLREVHSALRKAETSRLIVASVFPFSPYVEKSDNGNNKPTERLHINAKTLEGQIEQWEENVFKPSGFEIERFTRVPYLCEGDLYTSFYILHDIIFLLRPI